MGVALNRAAIGHGRDDPLSNVNTTQVANETILRSAIHTPQSIVFLVIRKYAAITQNAAVGIEHKN